MLACKLSDATSWSFAYHLTVQESHFQPPPHVDSTSTRLLARVVKRDPESWRQFVQIYGPVVRYWIRRAGLASADLADVFQEVFVAVARSLPQFERQAGKAKFRAWLKTVTNHKVIDHVRRATSQPQTFGGSTNLQRYAMLPEAAENTLSQADEDASLRHSEDAFVAQRTLQLVKAEFRDSVWQAFQLTAIEGLTSQEVAARLGMTALAVRKAKSRVLQRLKLALGQVES